MDSECLLLDEDNLPFAVSLSPVPTQLPTLSIPCLLQFESDKINLLAVPVRNTSGLQGSLPSSYSIYVLFSCELIINWTVLVTWYWDANYGHRLPPYSSYVKNMLNFRPTRHSEAKTFRLKLKHFWTLWE